MKARNIVAEISVLPVGTGQPGVSEYVAACMSILNKQRKVVYKLTPMGTVLQGTLEDILVLTGRLHEVPFNKGALRVVTTLKIDDRRDKMLSMEGKLASVRKKVPTVKI